MPQVPFDALPDDARLWVFAASRPLSGAEGEELLRHVDAHLATWAAHGIPLRCGRHWRYDRFLLVAVDERAAGASGCSIDALVHAVREAERRLDVALTDNAAVWFRRDGELRRASREEFRRLAAEGAVTLDTVVFDNTVTTVGAMRAGGWERPARQTWHARAFFGPRPAATRPT